MLNSVSFGSNAGVFDKPNLTKPQANARPAAQPEVTPQAEPKKKSKVGKYILGAAIAAATVAGLLVAGNKTGVLKNVGKYIPESIKNASWLSAAKEPAKKAIGAMDKAGGFIAENAVKGYNFVKEGAVGLFDKAKGLFSKGGEAAAEAAETVA